MAKPRTPVGPDPADERARLADQLASLRDQLRNALLEGRNTKALRQEIVAAERRSAEVEQSLAEQAAAAERRQASVIEDLAAAEIAGAAMRLQALAEDLKVPSDPTAPGIGGEERR